MNVVPFTASPDSDAAEPAQTDAADARQRMLGVKRKLQDVSGEIESIQSALASQQELEQLLKQGRAHLQDLRGRLQLTAAERDRLQAELADSASAHQRAMDQLERQAGDLRAQFQGAAVEREQLTAQLAEQSAAHEQFVQQRADEHGTFKRLLDEASSIQRQLTEEVQEQRQQIHTLREAAMRAQAFAREIMRTHEADSAGFQPEAREVIGVTRGAAYLRCTPRVKLRF